ncbi:MAG TPA: hypothetical protein VH299_14590 [Solirubrobacterales bacterium]|jgi:type IV secretory pathway VirB4 component|nr:hypothetical protein [Solirubrobacterales bacterium]
MRKGRGHPALTERYPAKATSRRGRPGRRHGERPGNNVTSAHLQAVYPFLAEAGLGTPGVYLGRDPYGGSVAYDPWELYGRGLLGDQNMLVLGNINSRKSSFVKTYILRQLTFGREAWVLDVKGEYAAMARAIGHEPIRLVPGGSVRLNPLRPRGGREAQLSLLRSVTAAALGRSLTPEEDAGLRVALDHVNLTFEGREPTLPEVVRALLGPSEAMVAAVSAPSVDDFAAANREAALALQRLTDGDLRGMFDGPTSEGLDLDAPLVVLDLSGLSDSAAFGVLMICAAAWQQSILLERAAAAEAGGESGAKLIFVVEEGWRVLEYVGFASWLRESFKLCRKLGVQNIVVAHRVSDFGALGAEGSREARIAQGLPSDAETVVLNKQSADQEPVLRDAFGMGSTETELVVTLRPDEYLLRVGAYSVLVQAQVSAWELELLRTSARLVEAAEPGA